MRTPAPAALLVATLLACGGSYGPRTGAVTVRVAWGAPVAGAPVVFHRPDGSVQEVAATDADGTASAVIEDGALVTVGAEVAGSDRRVLTTVAGVSPGDHLSFEDSIGFMLAGSAEVAFSGPVENATSYRVDAACTAVFRDDVFVSLLPMPLTGGCGDAIDALAIARAPGGGLLAYSTAVGVPIQGSASHRSASVALGPWRTDFGTLAVEATEAPAGAAQLTVALEPRRGGRSFSQSTTGGGVTVAGGEIASLALLYPQDFATSARLDVTLWFESNGAASERAGTVDPAAPLDRPFAVDLSALPPRLSQPAVAWRDDTLVASWRQAAEDPALDGVVLAATWPAPEGQREWRMVVPPGTTSVTLPALPPELDAFAPPAGAAPANVAVSSYDLMQARGYASFRTTHLGWLFGLEIAEDVAYRHAGAVAWTPDAIAGTVNAPPRAVR